MIHFQVRHLMGVLKCHQLIAIPITTGKKKDSVVCPLLRHSNYDRKKMIQLSGHHSLHRSNCHCCAVPIMTGKKVKSSVRCYAIPNMTTKKKIQSSGHHSLRHSNCHCYVMLFQLRPKKKRYSHLSIVMPFQI